MHKFSHENLHKQGIAVGSSDIRSDTITFRWRDETFTFAALLLFSPPVAFYNGYFYEAKVKKLRALKRKMRHG